MKIRFSTLLCCCLFFFCLSANVAAQKYGHMNYNNLIVELPKTKAADSQLEAYQKQLSAQLEKKGKALEQKFLDAQAKAQSGEWSPKMIQEKEAELEKERQTLAAEQSEAQQKVLAKREELFKPIFDEVNAAIEAVGKENGYTFIFNESTGVMLYNIEADDVLPLVKAKLGLQ